MLSVMYDETLGKCFEVVNRPDKSVKDLCNLFMLWVILDNISVFTCQWVCISTVILCNVFILVITGFGTIILYMKLNWCTVIFSTINLDMYCFCKSMLNCNIIICKIPKSMAVPTFKCY